MRELLRRAAGRRVTVGFDGFIDTIARPVARTATADAPAQYFESIPAFGQYLVEHGGKCCSIALHVERRQLGGNLPHLSRAASMLGLDVSCVGMLGQPGIDPVFSDLPCKLYSFAPAGEATALEFSGGKVFLAADAIWSDAPWQDVCAHVPQAEQLFRETELIALVNWSELDASQALWQAVYDHAVRPDRANFSRFAFFDLCDCTRRSAEQLDQVQVTTSTVQAALRCSPGYPTATVSTLPVSLPRLMYPRAAPRRWTKCWMRCKTRKKRERKRVLSFLFEHAQNRYRKSRPDRDGFDDLFYALCSMQCAQVPWATRV